MAKRRKSEQRSIAPPSIANIPRDPETLAKIDERELDAYADPDRDEAKAKEAIEKVGKRAKHRPTAGDIAAVSDRLEDAGYALLAIRKIAIEAVDGDDDGFYSVAIQELARSTVKGIDACIERLTGHISLGNFRSELDRE